MQQIMMHVNVTCRYVIPYHSRRLAANSSHDKLLTCDELNFHFWILMTNLLSNLLLQWTHHMWRIWRAHFFCPVRWLEVGSYNVGARRIFL